MRMIKPLALAATIALVSGCATTDGLLKSGSENRPVSAQDKSQARKSALREGVKGCGIGAVVGTIGALLGNAGGAQAAIVGCLGGGLSVGMAEYKSQLNDARALQGQVTVGAVVKIDETEKVVQGEKVESLGRMSLDLDAKKVADRHQDILIVVARLTDMLNKQTIDLTVNVSGSQSDRDWLVGALKAKLSNDKVSIVQSNGDATVIVVSPMPDLG